MFKSLLSLGAAATLVAGVLPHADYKSSIPAKNATVAAPKSISITFTEGVKVALSGISILKSDSSVVETLKVVATKDPATIEGAVTKTLAPGKYIIKWKNGAADDGHAERGAFAFMVK